MRRPQAPRRLRAGAFDRRIAVVAASLTAVVLVVTVSVARGPQLAVDRPDAAAARELVNRMRAGERSSWLVTYEFTRTLANGRVLQQSMREGRVPLLHVLASGTSMTIQKRDERYDCNLVADRSECSSSPAARVLAPSEVLRVAVAAGAYGVARLPTVTIAGERAHCFRVLPIGHGYLPDIGAETETCLGTDGVSLRQRVVNSSGDVDERVATSVTPRVARGVIEAVIRGFDPQHAG